MPERGIYRGASAKGFATPTNAPLRVDSTTNILKFIPAGSGSTEIEQIDASSVQTLTNKTLTSPTLATPTITSPAISTPTITGVPNINVIKSAFSTAQVSAGYAADTYLAGSGIAMPTGGFVAGHRYSCIFDMVKTNAGTAQFTITLRIGTAASTADTAICAFAFGSGTAAADTGTFEVSAYFRTVGATTTAVVVGIAECSHHLAATGLVSTGASGWGEILTVSSGFDSTVAATTIGLSVNGGTSFSGTNSFVQTELRGF